MFGAGRFAPGTHQGRRLIGHELTHVVQQRGEAELIQRKLNVEDFDVGSFDLPSLQAYLGKIRKAGRIEDDSDSDDKARTIVKEWRKGTDDFILDPPTKVLLIKEMQSGFTGNDDERAILTLLLNSAHADVEAIFGPKSIDPDDLDSDFHGAEEDELRAFYDREFVGGRKAALKGSHKMQAQKLRGLSSPYTYAELRAMIDQRTERIDRTVRDRPVKFRPRDANELAHQDGADIYVELQKLTADERGRAAADMARDRVKKAAQADVLDEDIASAKDKGSSERLARRQVVLRAEVLMLDLGMQSAFRDIAVAEPPATLLPKTRLPTAAEKVEIAKALKPELRLDVGGVPLPFVEHIPGEPKTYGEKISDYMPTMVAEYYAAMVAGKGPAEHADPAKTHKLDEFDSIANAAKEATDRVFGAYKLGSAFRSDRPPPIGRGQLHDLFADTQSQLAAMSPAAKRGMAKALVMYFFQSDEKIGGFNRKHNADPKFNAAGLPLNTEATILNTIANGWVSSVPHVTELNEIDRNWDASADPTTHEVNIQIFKKSTPAEDRRFLWDMYQTLIHEYIHTLAHPDYVRFAEGFGPSQENNTLIEGVDSFLTEIVWSKAKAHTAEPAVRAKVEGAAYSGLPFDASVIPPVYGRRYSSYAQAIKLVNVMGVRNVYAAYFLGKVDLIKIP